jgi:hypothetical protein
MRRESSQIAPKTCPAVKKKLETVLMEARIVPTQPGRKPPRNARIEFLVRAPPVNLPKTSPDEFRNTTAVTPTQC